MAPNNIDEGALNRLARKLGCDLEVYSEIQSTRVFSSEGGRLHAKDAVTNAGFAVRTIKGRQLGFYSFENAAEFAPAVEKALRLGKHQEKGDYYFPANVGSSEKYFDNRARGFGEWAMIEIEGMHSAHRKAGVVPVQNMLGASISEKRLENSEGGRIRQKESAFFALSQCGFKETEADDSISCARYNFSPADAARNAAKFARASANAKKTAGGKASVIFDIRALHQLLPLFMPFNFSGESLQKKLTKLAFGAPFALETISISDDPFMAEGVRPAVFDDEGFKCAKRALVDRGAVNEYAFDMRSVVKMRKTAARNAPSPLKPGNAARGSFNSPPSISFSNMAIEGGDASDLVKECKSGIYVNSFLTSGANPVTGDFTFPLLVAFKVSRGEPINAIRGAMMKGNFFELMKGAIFERETEIYNGLRAGRMACDLEIIS
ncbi:MAG TPA: TldD/PmbA family protein [Candidatus Norongarragalinales archaeon]|nr:TldD/PmbA family protein [Candidatus Norongarragalinales archaeon]